MIQAPPDQALVLSMQATDEATGLFPQAAIYNAAGSLVTTITLTHVAAGLYQGTWAAPALGLYAAIFRSYTDAGHTIRSSHETAQEDVLIAEDVSALTARLLAHAGENIRDDSLAFDTNGRLTSARRRIFPDEATALASTPGGTGEGETATITITATHLDGVRWESLLRTTP